MWKTCSVLWFSATLLISFLNCWQNMVFCCTTWCFSNVILVSFCSAEVIVIEKCLGARSQNPRFRSCITSSVVVCISPFGAHTSGTWPVSPDSSTSQRGMSKVSLWQSVNSHDVPYMAVPSLHKLFVSTHKVTQLQTTTTLQTTTITFY